MVALVRFSDFVSFQLKAFKLIGLVSQDSDLNEPLRLRLIQKVYHYFVILSLMYFLCTLMLSMWENIDNLAMFTELLSTFGYAVLAIVRMVSINLRRNEFGNLMNTLNKLFPKTNEDQEASETRKCYDRFNVMRRIISGFIMSGGLIFLVGPFTKFISTGNWINRLPFPIWFPFDPYNPSIYNFVLLWQLHDIICINASLVGPDMMLYAFCTLISMEFDNLCKRIRELENASSNDVSQKINEMIVRHQLLIRLSENLEKIFSVVIFFNFFEASLLICMYGYQITSPPTLQISSST